jgi:predicted alpha/beta hydrolase family esterase
VLLPGWLDSDAAHWQSRQLRHGFRRVVQDDSRLAGLAERAKR